MSRLITTDLRGLTQHAKALIKLVSKYETHLIETEIAKATRAIGDGYEREKYLREAYEGSEHGPREWKGLPRFAVKLAAGRMRAAKERVEYHKMQDKVTWAEMIDLVRAFAIGKMNAQQALANLFDGAHYSYFESEKTENIVLRLSVGLASNAIGCGGLFKQAPYSDALVLACPELLAALDEPDIASILDRV